MPIPKYICIEGVIGVGKTSLTRMLGEWLDAKVIYERPEENPFLQDFYKDPQRFAFQAQLFFLLSRYRQQQEGFQPDFFMKLWFQTIFLPKIVFLPI